MIERISDVLKEGTWALPDTPAKVQRLRALLSKPLLSSDALLDRLYPLLGDDELFDEIEDLAGSQKDVRPLILARMRELGYGPLVNIAVTQIG